MKLKILIALMLIASCTARDCLKNSTMYKPFQELFQADEELLTSSSKEDIAAYENDKRLRDTIFSKIPNAASSPQKLLFLRKIVVLDDTQTGLIYVKTDAGERFFYFQKKKNSSVIIGEGKNINSDLAKLLTVLKDDFYKKSQELKEYFEKRSLGDAPSLQIAFVDLSNKKTTKGILTISLGHLDNLFDETFHLKPDTVK